MALRLETEVKVGLFVVAGMALTAIAILVLGSTESLTVSKDRYTIHFPSVEGLVAGAKVDMDGLQVGIVESADYDENTHDVRMTISIQRKSEPWIRKDATAEVATQGVLGDKFVIITPGSPDQPQLPVGAEIPPRPSEDLTQFLSKSDRLMASVTSLVERFDRVMKSFEFNGRSDTFFQGLSLTAKNLSTASDLLNHELNGLKLKAAVGNLNGILEKINNGNGTLGALVNDPELYDEARALVGGANRNRIIRNLVRQTIRKSEQEQEEAQPAAPRTKPGP